MKKLICFLFTILSVSAYGNFSTEKDNSRTVSDLMYLPEAGTYFVDLQGTSVNTDVKTTYVNTGLNYSLSEVKTNSTSLVIGGVMKGDMLVSLTVPYQLKSEDTTTYGPATTTNGTKEVTKSKGPGDLDLNFKWRISNQNEKGIKLDLKANVSPKTGKAESGSTTQEGNNFRGGTNFGFGMEVGKKLKSIQFSGELNLDFNGSRKTKTLSNGNTTSISSYNDFSLGGTVQLQPNEKFFLNAGLFIYGGSDFSTTASGTTTEYEADPYLQYGGAVGYVISNSVVLRVVYSAATVDRELTQGVNVFLQEFDAQTLEGILQVQF